jgi:putative copper export protein
MELKVLIVLHVLSAATWIGSLLITTLGVLPKAMKQRNPQLLVDFENNFKILQMIALTLQFLTGFRMAMKYAPISQWFATDNAHSYYIQLKLMLLLITVLTYVFNRIFVVKKASEANLNQYAIHLILLTFTSVLLAIVGLSFRLNII